MSNTQVRTIALYCQYYQLILFFSGYPPFQNLLKAYGIIAFQFDIHPMLLTIEVDMEKKEKIGKAVTYGILGTGPL